MCFRGPSDFMFASSLGKPLVDVKPSGVGPGLPWSPHPKAKINIHFLLRVILPHILPPARRPSANLDQPIPPLSCRRLIISCYSQDNALHSSGKDCRKIA